MKYVFSLSIALLVLFVGCGKPSAEEYKAKAEQALTEKNIPLAIEMFNKIIETDPSSPLADDAAFRIASIHNNETSDYQAAVDAYKRYVALFPEGEKAPVAMFLTGFLYHNELQNLDSTKVSFERFLTKFPEHEMALSAQFELNNLGKSPESLFEGTAPKHGDDKMAAQKITPPKKK